MALFARTEKTQREREREREGQDDVMLLDFGGYHQRVVEGIQLCNVQSALPLYEGCN